MERGTEIAIVTANWGEITLQVSSYLLVNSFDSFACSNRGTSWNLSIFCLLLPTTDFPLLTPAAAVR